MNKTSALRIDIDGQRFGKWLVTSYAGRGWWDCRCDCGTVRKLQGYALRKGQSTQCRNCGNRIKANLGQRFIHGHSDGRLHRIWSMMKARCYRRSSPDYHRYGGRGITICDAWSEFLPFYNWALANGYDDRLTIDRRDNSLGYSPENCRWITRTAQNRNRRDNVRFAWRGRQLMLSEIAEIVGISHSTLRRRVVRDGWDLERAARQPVKQGDFTRKSLKERVK